MIRRRLILVLFVVIAGTASFGARSALNSLSQQKSPGYTIVWQVTDYFAGGGSALDYTETRYVSSTGNWRDIKQYTDGRSEESFAEVGRGVYLRRGQKLHFVSEYGAPPPLLSEERLRNSPNYLRTDNVLGYQAIVVSPGNRPRTGSEFYKVPALGGQTIKTVICYDEQGNKTVLEPISLTLGEPNASLLKTPSGLPVDYENFKRTHPGG